MTAQTEDGASPKPPGRGEDVLDSWKDIAAYLQRDVRTVMRWEHRRALPVHRLPGGPKAAVYALKSELETWRAARVATAGQRDDADEGASNDRGESGANVSSTTASTVIRSRRSILIFTGIFVFLLAVAAVTVRLSWHRGGPAAPAIRSLAVLPFENLTRDPAQDYFADGMHEALITDLARVSGVRVVSRTSATHYRDARVPARQIADELHVDALVEGSVLRVGNRVRINAQLVRADTDEHVWAASYDHNMDDALGLIARVSQAIAGEIQHAVAGRASPSPSDGGALVVQPDALDAYLRGRYAFHSMTPDGLQTALTLYRKATAIDPGFARGWAGIASALSAQAFVANAPPARVLPEARAAALRALALDDRLGEAHGTIGYVALYWDWDFETAGKRLARAVELSPATSGVRHEYADYLLIKGDVGGSLNQMRLAHDNDPLSSPGCSLLLYHALMARKYDEVIDEGRKMMTVSGVLPIAHDYMGRALWLEGRRDEALAEWKQALTGDSDGYLTLEEAFGTGGPTAALKARAEHVAARARNGLEAPVYVASWFAAAGEADQAFGWLEQAYARRDPLLLHVIAEPFFDPIRSDPRFAVLLRRIGLSPLPIHEAAGAVTK